MVSIEQGLLYGCFSAAERRYKNNKKVVNINARYNNVYIVYFAAIMISLFVWTQKYPLASNCLISCSVLTPSS